MCADIIHEGHIKIIKRAKEISKYASVGLHTDDFIEKYKGAKPIMTFEERLATLKGITDGLIWCLDSWVIPETFDYVLHGSDWRPPYTLTATQGYIEVPCFKGITSSIIKERIKNA